MEKIPEKEPVLFTKNTSKIYSLMGAIYSLNPSSDMKIIEKEIDELTEESISDIENFNRRLKELGLGVSIKLKDIESEKRYESYMNILNSGKSIIASCTIQTEDEEKIHYIALAKVYEEIVLMDPNTKLGYANTDILRDMLNYEREIGYLGDSSIRFDSEPIIVVERV